MTITDRGANSTDPASDEPYPHRGYADRLTLFRDVGQPQLVHLWNACNAGPDRASIMLTKYLARVLVSKARPDGTVAETLEQLALEVAEPVRTVKRARRWLETSGWLELVQPHRGPGRPGPGNTTRQGRPAVYRIVFLRDAISNAGPLDQLSTGTQETGATQVACVSQETGATQVACVSNKQVPVAQETGATQVAPTTVLDSTVLSRVTSAHETRPPAGRHDQRETENQVDDWVGNMVQRVLERMSEHADHPGAYALKLRQDKALMAKLTNETKELHRKLPGVPVASSAALVWLVCKAKGEQTNPATWHELELEQANSYPIVDAMSVSA